MLKAVNILSRIIMQKKKKRIIMYHHLVTVYTSAGLPQLRPIVKSFDLDSKRWICQSGFVKVSKTTAALSEFNR